MYLAVKRHFGGNFDYFKYNGKVSVTRESFERRRDRFKFEKLANHHDPLGLLVANLSRDPEAWVGDIVSGDDSSDRYAEYVKSTQSFSYFAREQISKIASSTLQGAGAVSSTSRPEIAKLVSSGQMSMEIASMLDLGIRFTDGWVSSGDPVLQKLGERIRRYRPFVKRQVSPTQLVEVVKKIFDEDGRRIGI